MSLWEYNACMKAAATRQSDRVAGAVLTGYYAAYYMSAKKPKAPDRVIAALYAPKSGRALPVDVIRRLEKKKEEM